MRYGRSLLITLFDIEALRTLGKEVPFSDRTALKSFDIVQSILADRELNFAKLSWLIRIRNGGIQLLQVRTGGRNDMRSRTRSEPRVCCIRGLRAKTFSQQSRKSRTGMLCSPTINPPTSHPLLHDISSTVVVCI